MAHSVSSTYLLVSGLDAVAPESRTPVVNYIAEAFRLAHIIDQDARVAEVLSDVWGQDYVEGMINRIKFLHSVYAIQNTPSQLVEIVKLLTDDLIQYLKKHPRAIYEIRPRQFEELIAEILASYGWVVQLTAPTKDGGYDIFAISKDIAGVQTSWIIECKKYKPENRIGIDIAHKLYCLKGELRVANAMLATTSYFTRGVKNFKASRYDFELRDYENISEWIKGYHLNSDKEIYTK